jgi:ABC-2 type transport system ATP-binding protein
VLADVSMASMTASATPVVHVSTPQVERLRRALAGPGVTVTLGEDGLSVTGRTSEQIARAALEEHLLLTALTPQVVSLEDAYLALTRDDVEYAATTPGPRRPAA